MEKVSIDKYDIIRSGHQLMKRFEIIESVIKKYKHSISKISEFGCGSGKMAFLLAKKFTDKEFLASDVREDFIEYAKNKYKLKNLRFKLFDLEKETIKKKFDFIYTIDVIHHLRNQKRAIENIYNGLKKDGLWLTIEPNSLNPYIFLTHKLAQDENTFKHRFLRKYKILMKGYTIFFPHYFKVNAFMRCVEEKVEKFPLFGGSVYHLIQKQ